MSDEKNMRTGQPETRLRPARRLNRKPFESKQDVEVISLEIDEDFDLGGDPYNRTGTHCVIEIRKD